MYEAMAIQSLLPLMGYKSATAEGDKEMIQRFCQDAKQNLEALIGVPVAQVQFTHKGVVIQK